MRDLSGDPWSVLLPCESASLWFLRVYANDAVLDDTYLRHHAGRRAGGFTPKALHIHSPTVSFPAKRVSATLGTPRKIHVR
jgi:hypothetical protein